MSTYGLSERVMVELTRAEAVHLEAIARTYDATPEHIARALLCDALSASRKRTRAALLAFLRPAS